MNAILDFVRAAFPWVLAGVAVVVLCVRHSKQQNREEPRQDYSAEGICLGMCLGVTMATTFGGMENLGLAFRWECWWVWPLAPAWKSRTSEQTALLFGELTRWAAMRHKKQKGQDVLRILPFLAV